MFNGLTGSMQYVGNWPGVTVEKKEGRLRGSINIVIQDLPGIYSLSPYTLEEVISRNYLINEKPDAILNIVDGSNIERNLYLTTQLLEIGLPMVIALNMIDIVRKNGDVINIKKLSVALGCEIIETSALKGEGSKAAAERAAELAVSGAQGEHPHVFGGTVEHAIANIEDIIGHLVDRKHLLGEWIVGGVGAVLGFVPQMLILFLMLAILEDIGYMARVAFIMDRIFRKFGLSGKSFIPMLIGSGCSVPGIMASRAIENERDRRMTIMTTSFIPCGAKIPIVALIAGALFGGARWVAPTAYFAGVAAVIVSGIMLKKTKMFAGQPAPLAWSRT